MYSATRKMKNREIAQGTITKSSVKPAGVYFLPDVEYKYFVLGVEYKGISVTIPPDLIYDEDVLQGLLEEYPIYQKVDVFHEPENPGIAVLENKASIATPFILFIAIGTATAFLIFGFAVLLRLL